jgi:hypothetical protein
MRDVHTDALVRLNLVEQISALGQLEREPYPRLVLAGGEVLYDVGVLAQALVQRELELDLLGAQAADAEGMVFVDELDGDDGCCGFGRDGFADTVEEIVLLVWFEGREEGL